MSVTHSIDIDKLIGKMMLLHIILVSLYYGLYQQLLSLFTRLLNHKRLCKCAGSRRVKHALVMNHMDSSAYQSVSETLTADINNTMTTLHLRACANQTTKYCLSVQTTSDTCTHALIRHMPSVLTESLQHTCTHVPVSVTCLHRQLWAHTALASPPHQQSGQSRSPSPHQKAVTGTCRWWQSH